MVKISEAITKLWLSKSELLDLIKDITWKEYSPKTTKISDAVFQEVLDNKNGNNKNSKKEENKEVSFWSWSMFGDDFLSWMWFSTPEPVKEEIEESTEDTSEIIKKEEKTEDTSESIKKEAKKKSEPIKEENKNKTEEKSTKKIRKNIKFEEKKVSSSIVFNTAKKTEKKSSVTFTKKEDSKPIVKKFERIDSKNFSSSKPKFSTDNKTTSNKKLKKKAVKATLTKSEEEKRKRAPKKKVPAQASSTIIKKDKIIIWDIITVKEFSEKMWVPLSEVIKKLLMNKIILSATSNMDFDTATLIWEEFEVIVTREETSVSIEDIIDGNLEAILAQDKEAETLENRPPIVTIMWHVDHWKTKLLDYIRKTNIVDWEAWWITQSIWASQITHNDKKITFIDTPWHELFTSLRARWSKITDIVIIVVAADDWVKEQTLEAINHAKDSWVPIIVAITKIDKPNVNVEQIKSEVSKHWLIPEDWGWDTSYIPLSWITWEWVEDLLEMILLQSEMLELKYNPNRWWVWVVLESKKNALEWIRTSMIVMTWTLKVWDVCLIHNTFWKVRKIINWMDEEISIAKWWDPIRILWIHDIPEPWRFTEIVKNEKEANLKINIIKSKENKKIATAQNIMDKISQWENVHLKLVLKADSFGSLEACKYALSKIEMPENIELKLIHENVWSFNISDVMLAQAWWAILLWFNIPIKQSLKKKTEQLKVTMKSYDIIYELVSYIEWIAKWLIQYEAEEVITWKLDVLWIFFKRWKEMVVWWKVIEWKILNNSKFRIHRKDEIVGWWKITSLKRETENVNEVKEGYECWMKIKTDKKIVEWDIIEFYIME